MQKRCPFCGSEMKQVSSSPFDVLELIVEGRTHHICERCGFVAAFLVSPCSP